MAESEALLRDIHSLYCARPSTWHPNEMAHQVEGLVADRLAAIERAARASLADEARAAERKRSDAEREVAAMREALESVRAGIERGRFLAGTPGRRSEARSWFGDALNRIDAALAKEEGS